jgi:hypothetical protein
VTIYLQALRKPNGRFSKRSTKTISRWIATLSDRIVFWHVAEACFYKRDDGFTRMCFIYKVFQYNVEIRIRVARCGR